MRYVNLAKREAAKLAIDSALVFWQQARLQTRASDKCVDKLINMYEEYREHQKINLNTCSAAKKQKYDDFIAYLDNLFDIAHANVMQLTKNEEDKAFLQLQRQNGRPGSMLGVDKKLDDKEKRSQLRKEQESARRLKHLQAEASASALQKSGINIIFNKI